MRSFSDVLKLMILVSAYMAGPGLLRAESETESDLEEKLLTNLLAKRVHKRSDSSGGNSSDLNFLRGDGRGEIGQSIVNDIKEVKEPALDFLATSGLISWPELTQRYNKLKKAMEVFEAKHKNELVVGMQQQAAAMPPMNTAAIVAKPLAQIATTPVTAPAVGGMPGLATPPPVKPAVIPVPVPAMPLTKPIMPAVPSVVKPAGSMPLAPAMPVVPAVQEAEEIVEEEEEGGMPGLVPAQSTTSSGMPGISPAKPVVPAMPVPAPQAMLPSAPKPMTGGMPMAR